MSLERYRDWGIAYAGSLGQGYVGKIDSGFASHNDVTFIGPIYVLTTGYQIIPPQHRGEPPSLQRPIILFPFELLITPPSMRIACHGRLLLADLESEDFRIIARQLDAAVTAAEQMREGVRSARAGIVMPPMGLKV